MVRKDASKVEVGEDGGDSKENVAATNVQKREQSERKSLVPRNSQQVTVTDITNTLAANRSSVNMREKSKRIIKKPSKLIENESDLNSISRRTSNKKKVPKSKDTLKKASKVGSTTEKSLKGKRGKVAEAELTEIVNNDPDNKPKRKPGKAKMDTSVVKVITIDVGQEISLNRKHGRRKVSDKQESSTMSPVRKSKKAKTEAKEIEQSSLKMLNSSRKIEGTSSKKQTKAKVNENEETGVQDDKKRRKKTKKTNRESLSKNTVTEQEKKKRLSNKNITEKSKHRKESTSTAEATRESSTKVPLTRDGVLKRKSGVSFNPIIAKRAKKSGAGKTAREKKVAKKVSKIASGKGKVLQTKTSEDAGTKREPKKQKPLPKVHSDDVKFLLRSLAARARFGGVQAEDLAKLTVNDLKLALKYNDRTMTGNRDELVKQVMDCMEKGCPPRCPDCYGGRLKFGLRAGLEQYWCPGYVEDLDFVYCDFTAFEEWGVVKRIPWKCP